VQNLHCPLSIMQDNDTSLSLPKLMILLPY
jgi:hypothetical protein